MEKIIDVFNTYNEAEKLLVDDINTLTASRIIKVYCNKHKNCETCIFSVCDSNGAMRHCKITEAPYNWEV